MIRPGQPEWAQWWDDMRRRGKRYLLWRGCVYEGMSFGLVLAVFAALAQRAYGDADIQSWSWPFLAFLFSTAGGFVHAWWHWHANERCYRQLHSSKGY